MSHGRRAAVLIAIVSFALLSSLARGACLEEEGSLVQHVNNLRQKKGLSDLRWSKRLEVSAQAWADFLAADRNCQAVPSGAPGEVLQAGSDTCVQAAKAWLKAPQGCTKKTIYASSATEFACGKATGKDECTITVCRFAPVGEPLTTRGSAVRRSMLTAETSDPGSETSDPGSEISDPGSETSDPGSETSDPSSEISDPGSETSDPSEETSDPGSETSDPSEESSGTSKGTSGFHENAGTVVPSPSPSPSGNTDHLEANPVSSPPPAAHPPPPGPGNEPDYVDYYSKDPIYRRLLRGLESLQ